MYIPSIGEAVRIITVDEEFYDSHGVFFNSEMMKYCGKAMTVKRIHKAERGRIYISDCEYDHTSSEFGGWFYTDEMIEPIYDGVAVATIDDVL